LHSLFANFSLSFVPYFQKRLVDGSSCFGFLQYPFENRSNFFYLIDFRATSRIHLFGKILYFVLIVPQNGILTVIARCQIRTENYRRDLINDKTYFWSPVVVCKSDVMVDFVAKVGVLSPRLQIAYIHTYPQNSVRNIGRPQRASIEHGCWLELVVRQKTFSHILSRLCASRWLWGVLSISFPVGSILKRCG
jgi:hypothetical protein